MLERLPSWLATPLAYIHDLPIWAHYVIAVIGGYIVGKIY